MAGGKWSRWGRGSCESWSLNLGGLIHFSIVRKIEQTKTNDLSFLYIGLASKTRDDVGHLLPHLRATGITAYL